MGQLLYLKENIQKLFGSKNIESSDLDWIMVHVLKIKRSELGIDRHISTKDIRRIYNLARKRIKGIPLSQVLGTAEFYGLNFIVNKNVLTPRPETELLVEQVKNENVGAGLDIGTGSGAIAITLNKLFNLDMTAVDISSKALSVAKKNNKKHGCDVKLLKSDLFSKLKNAKFDFIVSNPPYIKTEDLFGLDTEVKDHEPHLALDGGASGLEFYNRIIEDAPKFLKENGKIYFELGINQSEQVEELLKKDFYNIQVVKDYNKIDRIIKATKK